MNRETAPALSPIQVLSGVMRHNGKNWQKRDANKCESLDEYTGMEWEEIAEEIASIWLPVFKSKANLTLALDALRLSYQNQIESDFCAFYLCVLEGK
jgi:hypothetical protein